MATSEQIKSAAREYLAAFKAEFGGAPDFNRDASDREHASAYLTEVDDLGGISVEDWYKAVNFEAADEWLGNPDGVDVSALFGRAPRL